MNKRKWLDLPAILLFLGMIILAVVMAVLPEVRSGVEGGIRKIYLTLSGFEFEDIRKSPRGTEFVGNEMTLRVNGNTAFLPKVTLKGRGNSTWGQPKSPLVVKLDRKVDVLGGGESRKWLLLANYFDDTNLRNHIGLKIAKMLGMEYALDGDFAELYVNDEYTGLYYLTDKVEIAKDRVDLREPMGVLVERRDNVREDSDDICYKSMYEECFVVKDVVAKDNIDVAMKSFAMDFVKFEKALDDGDYESVKKMIDVRSFAQYYLLSEMTVNPDAYIVSEYFYKDGEDDAIHMGPGWDFDFALANERWVWTDDESYFSATELNKNVPDDGFITKLLDMPEFQAEVRAVYMETLGAHGKELIRFARSEAGRINLAALVNNTKWGLKDYNSEVRALISWLETRLKYLDEVFGTV